MNRQSKKVLIKRLLLVTRKFVQDVLAQIPWSHNITLMDKVKTAEEHIWYANATVQNAWSRNVLVNQFEHLRMFFFALK